MAGPGGRLARRLAALEAAAPPPAPCPRCQSWPPVAVLNDWDATRPAPWHRPSGALHCPSCHRPPPFVVAYTDDWGTWRPEEGRPA